MKPNIFFLSIDSFPANKCFGKNKSSKTPNIDSLIENGVLFNKTISSSDGTELSFASMFTSKYPSQIGLNDKILTKIPSTIPNMFTLLNENGYHAYGSLPDITSVMDEISKNFENSDFEHKPNFQLYDGLGQQILEKFKMIKLSEPWIYFIHLSDLHLSISLPPEFDKDEFGDNKYDRMVSALDKWLGKILEEIKLDNTLVVLTADHGEFIPSINYNGKIISNFANEFEAKVLLNIEANLPSQLLPIRNRLFSVGRKILKQKKVKEFSDLDIPPNQKRALLNDRNDPNGYLFDELVHVPLIFSGIDLKSKIITNMVRHVDIFPTIIELIGFQPLKANIEGRSLAPLLDNKPLEELPVFMECRNRITAEESRSVIGLRTSKWKYFRGRDKTRKRVFLFDLENDPLEEKNIKEQNPEIIEKMEKILEGFKKEQEGAKFGDEEIKKTEKELRKLGYI